MPGLADMGGDPFNIGTLEQRIRATDNVAQLSQVKLDALYASQVDVATAGRDLSDPMFWKFSRDHLAGLLNAIENNFGTWFFTKWYGLDGAQVQGVPQAMKADLLRMHLGYDRDGILKGFADRPFTSQEFGRISGRLIQTMQGRIQEKVGTQIEANKAVIGDRINQLAAQDGKTIANPGALSTDELYGEFYRQVRGKDGEYTAPYWQNLQR